jgi:hypothetical protein
MAKYIERLYKRRFDGYRGRGEFPGWWISLEESEKICGEAWWTLPPCRKVEPIQYDARGPNDRPIWLWERGDMYLGRWTFVKNCHLYSGLSLSCSRDGKVTVANWQEAIMQGPGEFFWLESSIVWEKNWLYCSPIKTGVKTQTVDNNWGRPFCFQGNFQDSMIHDDRAVVRIKKGTTRVGPWKNGMPVGDWNQHSLAPKGDRNFIAAAIHRPKVQENTPKPDWIRCGHNKGQWISLNDPRAFGGEAGPWWDLPPCRAVDLLRNIKDAPSDKPLFLYNDGNMYLGNWKHNGSNDKILRNGLGANCFFNKGYIVVCNWRNGEAHGMGERVWLESSITWKENSSFMERSSVRESGPDGLAKTIPFNYKGKFQRGSLNDMNAVVTLKDGTTRVGPWRAGQPVGNWHDHTLVIASSVPADLSNTKTKRNEKTAGAVNTSKQETEPSHSLVDERSNKHSGEFEESTGTTKRTNPSNMSTSIPVAKRPRRESASTNRDRFPSVPSVRAAVKTEDADVISICDSEESFQETSAQVNGKKNNDAAIQNVPIKCEYSGGAYSAWTEEEVRLHQISSFLCSDLIGGNPSKKTTDMYAAKLYENGFESVDMIKLYLERDHVRSFDWMTQLHRGIIIRKLNR